MTVPAARTPGIPPLTWAMWIVALTPLLQLIGTAVIDFDGYFRAVVDAALAQQRSGTVTTSLPPGAASSFLTLLAGGLLGFLAQVAFVVFAAVDWNVLRHRGVDRPFHWAWSFFVLISFGGFVYPIGRTVVARNRTSRSAWAPLAVFIVLNVAVLAVTIVKFASAFAVFGQLATQLQGLS